jgi:hypothetical protein
MTLGFDQSNLSNAATTLVALAATRQTRTARAIAGKIEWFDLSTEDGAKAYLIASAEDVYSTSGNGVVAQIREVVYYSIGVVFEVAPAEMRPPPVTRGLEPPAHLAYFWQVL